MSCTLRGAATLLPTGQARQIDRSLIEISLDVRNLGTAVFVPGATETGCNPSLFGPPVRPLKCGVASRV
jgi:hypothetical protein